jgi:hypothetical protein
MIEREKSLNVVCSKNPADLACGATRRKANVALTIHVPYALGMIEAALDIIRNCGCSPPSISLQKP